MRNLALRTLAILCTGIFWSTVGQARPLEKETKQIELTGEKSLNAMIDFGAGQIDLQACSPDLVLDALAHYDREYVDFFVDYSRRGDRGYLEASSEIDGSLHGGKLENEWQIGLTAAIPVDLELDIGAAEANVDFTGIKLTDLEIDIGAAEVHIWWDEPNPERLRELSVQCGASSLSIVGLGHANFEHLEFDGGVGSFELDFSGEWTASATADFDVGLGSLELDLPRDIGVRIETDDSFLSSIDVDREFDEVDDDLYETRNYDQAKIKLDIRIQLGMGSVDVRLKGR